MTVRDVLITSLGAGAGFFLAGLTIIVLFFLIVIFNDLMTLRNNVDKAWANIDVLLKKRLDLIPELVAVVRGYMKYERVLLEEIVRIRSDALRAESVHEKAKGNEALSASLRSVFLLAEQYPNLKASDNFLNLQHEIALVEDQIARRREFYNESVRYYNTRLQTIPSVFVAILLRLRPREYFRADPAAGQPAPVGIESR